MMEVLEWMLAMGNRRRQKLSGKGWDRVVIVGS
jgi:hypothetical protein